MSPLRKGKRSPLGFPLRGSWHGEAVTDEVDRYLNTQLSSAPHPGSLRSPTFPPRGKALRSV